MSSCYVSWSRFHLLDGNGSIDDSFVAVVSVNAELRVQRARADLMRMRRQTRPTADGALHVDAEMRRSCRSCQRTTHRRMLRR